MSQRQTPQFPTPQRSATEQEAQDLTFVATALVDGATTRRAQRKSSRNTAAVFGEFTELQQESPFSILLIDRT